MRIEAHLRSPHARRNSPTQIEELSQFVGLQYGSYTRTCDKTIRMSGNGGLFGNPSADKSGYSQGTIKTTAHCTSETMRSCLPCIL